MRPRFLADADLNHNIVKGLRRREPAVDIQDAWQGGVIGKPDPDVLLIAAQEGRILLSHDRHTIPAHFAEFVQANRCPGVILISQNLPVGLAIEDLLVIWAASEAEEWVNVVGSVPL